MAFILNDYQLDRLSEILGNAALVVWGSTVLPAFTGTVDEVSPFTVLLGLVGGFAFIILSLLLLRKVKK